MKFLIAGLGSIGQRHARNLLRLGQDDLVFYRTGLGTLEAPDLQAFPVETELDRALAQQPQAVVVSNPTALHLEVAIPAAKSGAALLLEKPISHTLENIDTLTDCVEQSGSRVLVGYQFRFHPGLLKLRELLLQGTIGEPLSFRACWGEYLPGWHPWEDYRQSYSARADLGGGVVLTISHPLDYLLWMFGWPHSLWATTVRHPGLDLGVEDTAEVVVEFAHGLTGSLHLDYTRRPPVHRLEIGGSQGTLIWDNQDGAVRLFQAPEGKVDAPEAAWQLFPLLSPENPRKPFERNDLFLAEMRHFIAMAQGQVAPACSLQDGVAALRVALAILQSAASGQKITLEPIQV